MVDRNIQPGAAAPLAPGDIVDAAKEIGCDQNVLRAVLRVETSGSGFLPDQRPKILFEAHWFSRYTGRRYDATHPAVSSRAWNRTLYVGGAGEYDRLSQALALDRAAALKSASWGLGQVMGGNYAAAGFADAESFVVAMCASEREQLLAMVRFIQSRGLADELRDERLSAFAEVYNGSGYKVQQYDVKMLSALAALRQAAQESTTPRTASTFQPTVRLETQAMQIALNLHGATLTADGFAGPKTTAAIKTFQATHGLVPDGIAGPKTRQALGL